MMKFTYKLLGCEVSKLVDCHGVGLGLVSVVPDDFFKVRLEDFESKDVLFK